jgi:hypothetical protein
MPDENLQRCAYHVVRYQPNLIRDEWVNIGVLLLIPPQDPSQGRVAGRVRQRWLDESADLARLRRLHPAVDEELLLRLPAAFEREFAGRELDAEALLEKFDGTLSNAVQFAPRKFLFSPDPDAELDRLFREQVEPLREARRGPAEVRTRADVRARHDRFRAFNRPRPRSRTGQTPRLHGGSDPRRDPEFGISGGHGTRARARE